MLVPGSPLKLHFTPSIVTCNMNDLNSYLLVNSEWQRDRYGDNPYGHNQQQAHEHFHTWLKRVDNHEISVYGDGRWRERGHIDRHAQCHGHDVAERLAKHPGLDESWQRGEGYRQQAHHDVGQCQVCDEDVRDSLHGLVACDHVDHEGIPWDTQQEDSTVERNEDGPNYGPLRYILVLGGIGGRTVEGRVGVHGAGVDAYSGGLEQVSHDGGYWGPKVLCTGSITSISHGRHRVVDHHWDPENNLKLLSTMNIAKSFYLCCHYPPMIFIRNLKMIQYTFSFIWAQQTC